MRVPTILFAAALCAVVVTPVFPQVRAGCQGRGDGTVTVSFNPPPVVNSRNKTGAPYSAVQSDRSVQTLPDGTRLTRNARTETATWRDSSGRVRTETHIPPGERATCNSSLVEIDDSVAGYVYLLDPDNQVAYRAPFTAPATAMRVAVQKPASQPTQPRSDRPAVTTESLGEKTMSGITVTGTRDIATYAAGSVLGNDRPVTQTSETWVSRYLDTWVYSRQTSYDGTVSTRELKDLSITEPDPSLFRIPPEYKVIDETGAFTLTIPGHS